MVYALSSRAEVSCPEGSSRNNTECRVPESAAGPAYHNFKCNFLTTFGQRQLEQLQAALPIPQAAGAVLAGGRHHALLVAAAEVYIPQPTW